MATGVSGDCPSGIDRHDDYSRNCSYAVMLHRAFQPQDGSNSALWEISMANSNTPSTAAQSELEGDRANRDLVTGAPGSHPVGTGVGAATGGAAGLGIGAAVAGPIGAAVGAAIGAVVGGLSGKATAEVIDPTVEDAYWRANFRTRPYVGANASYDEYAPAYRFGWENRMKAKDGVKRQFHEVEDELAEGWKKSTAKASLGWDKAKLAVRDAWDRRAIERAEGEGMTPGLAAASDGTTQAQRDAVRHTKPTAAPR